MSNISFQDGVVFYECSANELIDVEIEDYVDELVFGEKMHDTVYNLLNVNKSFPQIRTIVIEEGVKRGQTKTGYSGRAGIAREVRRFWFCVKMRKDVGEAKKKTQKKEAEGFLMTILVWTQPALCSWLFLLT